MHFTQWHTLLNSKCRPLDQEALAIMMLTIYKSSRYLYHRVKRVKINTLTLANFLFLITFIMIRAAILQEANEWQLRNGSVDC